MLNPKRIFTVLVVAAMLSPLALGSKQQKVIIEDTVLVTAHVLTLEEEKRRAINEPYFIQPIKLCEFAAVTSRGQIVLNIADQNECVNFNRSRPLTVLVRMTKTKIIDDEKTQESYLFEYSG